MDYLQACEVMRRTLSPQLPVAKVFSAHEARQNVIAVQWERAV